MVPKKLRRNYVTISLAATAILSLGPGISALHAENADRVALVIGNGAYEAIDPLPNPPNDVEIVAKALEGVGFRVTLLVNADRRTMDLAAKKFATELDDAGQNSVGVFYYAGHGVSYQGENWLLPIGAEITQAADIEYETISANKVLKLMEAARNATDILVLDACRNSPFRSFSLSGTRALSGGMSRMDAPTGSFIAYSTAPGAIAYDGDGSYSPFAEAFASEVSTSVSSIGDMMIEVRKKVKAKTAKFGKPQTPWDASSLTGLFAFNSDTANFDGGSQQVADGAGNSGVAEPQDEDVDNKASSSAAATRAPRLTSVSSGQEILKGSYTLDLDTGQLGGSSSDHDIWWGFKDENTRHLYVRNGARFSYIGKSELTQVSETVLLNADYSVTNLNGSPNIANQLMDGTVILVRTNTGNYSKLRIEKYGVAAPGDLPQWPKSALLIRWVTYIAE